MVELLMVMGIMSILVVILSEVFGSILTMKLRSQATTAVAQDSRYVISRLAYDISRATDITNGSGNTLGLVINGAAYTYSLQASTLVLSIDGGSVQALTGVRTKINSLSFTRTDVGAHKAVQINLNLAPVIIQPGGVTGARQLTTTVALR